MDDQRSTASPEPQQLEKPETSWWKDSGFHDFLSILAIGFIALCFALRLQAGWLIGGLLTFAAFQFLKAKVRENSKEKTFTEVITGIAALITGFVVLVFGATATFTYVGIVALLAWQALISITSFIYRFSVRSKIEEEYDEDDHNVPERSANNSLLSKAGFMTLGFIGLTIFAAVTFFAPFESVGIVTLAFVAPLVIATFFGFTGDPYAEVDKFISSEAEKGTSNESGNRFPMLHSPEYRIYPDLGKAKEWEDSYMFSTVEQDTGIREGLLKLFKNGNVLEWQLALTGSLAERNYHALIYYFGKPEAKKIYQLITSPQDHNQFSRAKQKFDEYFREHKHNAKENSLSIAASESSESADSSATAIVEFKNPYA